MCCYFHQFKDYYHDRKMFPFYNIKLLEKCFIFHRNWFTRKSIEREFYTHLAVKWFTIIFFLESLPKARFKGDRRLFFLCENDFLFTEKKLCSIVRKRFFLKNRFRLCDVTQFVRVFSIDWIAGQTIFYFVCRHAFCFA